MEKIDRIGLIAGSGKFPLFLANAARLNNVEVVVFAVNSEADKEIEKKVNKVYWLNLGEGKKLIEAIKAEDLKYITMAGKISKLTLIRESLRLDEEARKLMGRLTDRRDDTILKAIAGRLKEIGVEVLDSTIFLKSMMPPKGLLTKRKPDKREAEDIEFGFKIAKEMGGLDIGQSVVIKDKAVIAVEAIEGTDEAIRRAGRLSGPGSVVVKVSKPDQDLRFDVPVVGLTTIESLKEAQASCLAIEADRVMVLEKEEVIKEADKAGIAIIVV